MHDELRHDVHTDKMILDDRMSMACEHLRKKYNGYKSVYFFKKFDGFSLQK